VTNALDAVEERLATDGGTTGRVVIRVAVDRIAARLRLDVIDNGCGIPQDVLPGIFNIFVSTKGAKGTGLGLTVSRKILREHGGDITVESRPGEGTTFTLDWPLVEAD